MTPGKICPRCDLPQTEENSYLDTTKKSGFSTYCKSCTSKRAREYYESNHGWKVHLLNSARYRARKSGIPFSITLDDFEIPEFCPILGMKLTITTKRGAGPDSASIDRITPSLGYIPGNIQVISIRANKMKSDASVEELRRFADWINKRFPDIPDLPEGGDAHVYSSAGRIDSIR